jgi:hypothetical protein
MDVLGGDQLGGEASQKQEIQLAHDGCRCNERVTIDFSDSDR